MKTKFVLKSIYFLVVLQLLRIALKNICFLFITPTPITNISFNALFMIFATIFIIRVMKKYGYDKSLILNDYKKYGIIYLIIILIGLLSLLIGHNFNQENIITLLYSIIVLPIFEEILFRGYLWDRSQKIYKDNIKTLIILTIFFAIWHFGYIDSILINCIYYNKTFSFSILLWKAAIAMVFGIITGITRIKTKNCYSSILIHALLNIFAR